jgi:putative heme-binding domain-containing protein
LEMPQLLTAFERSQSRIVGQKLVASLGKAPGVQSLTPEALRRTLTKYPTDVQQSAQPLFKQLEADAAAQSQMLTTLKPVLTGGDAKRGREVFFSKKANCSTCHAVGPQGGQVGPDLTKIGASHTGPALLEAIVLPSASFARGYEPYIVETRQGQIYSGILRQQSADGVVLLKADLTEARISRVDIDSIVPGKVSIMPQGLEKELSRQELGDLIAFLLSLN